MLKRLKNLWLYWKYTPKPTVQLDILIHFESLPQCLYYMQLPKMSYTALFFYQTSLCLHCVESLVYTKPRRIFTYYWPHQFIGFGKWFLVYNFAFVFDILSTTVNKTNKKIAEYKYRSTVPPLCYATFYFPKLSDDMRNCLQVNFENRNFRSPR